MYRQKAAEVSGVIRANCPLSLQQNLRSAPSSHFATFLQLFYMSANINFAIILHSHFTFLHIFVNVSTFYIQCIFINSNNLLQQKLRAPCSHFATFLWSFQIAIMIIMIIYFLWSFQIAIMPIIIIFISDCNHAAHFWVLTHICIYIHLVITFFLPPELRSPSEHFPVFLYHFVIVRIFVFDTTSRMK